MIQKLNLNLNLKFKLMEIPEVWKLGKVEELLNQLCLFVMDELLFMIFIMVIKIISMFIIIFVIQMMVSIIESVYL